MTEQERELIAAAIHYVKIARDPARSEFIRENGRHCRTSPWAELVEAVEAVAGDAQGMKMPDKVRPVATDSLGNTLYVEDTEQGRCYWSDEIACGVCVWHTALVSPEILRMALAAEEEYDRSSASP